MNPSAPDTPGIWTSVRRALFRTYRVTPAMVLLVSLTVVCLLITERALTVPVAKPELVLERLAPLEPAWALVSGALSCS